jgi:hypothetical protein
MTETANTTQAKTAWYLTTADGLYADQSGHVWFTKPVALAIGRQLGIIPERSTTASIKTVVTGYTS